MRDTKDRPVLVWVGVALVGAACLAKAAFAGNYTAVVPSNSGIEYYSVEMTVGQRLKTTTEGAQLLVDDITYGVEILPDAANSGVVYPLWLPTDLQASYETSGTVSTYSNLVSTPYTSQIWTAGIATTILPSTRTISFDVESFSVARFAYFAAEMQEVDGGNNFVRAFDETTQVAHGAMFARLEHIPGGGRGDALGLGISEAIATLSESRHYQTPHIVPYGHEVACNTVGTVPHTLIQVYVKGRVIVDGGDALTDAGANVTVH